MQYYLIRRDLSVTVQTVVLAEDADHAFDLARELPEEIGNPWVQSPEEPYWERNSMEVKQLSVELVFPKA